MFEVTNQSINQSINKSYNIIHFLSQTLIFHQINIINFNEKIDDLFPII